MPIHRIAATVTTIAFSLLSGAWAAVPVTLVSNGITHNANLSLVSDNSLEDGAIMLVHGTLAHNEMEIMVGLQEALGERGINTLAINLSLGIDNRRGQYDCNVPHHHLHDDAVEDIALWHMWLSAKGAERIGVLGHSRGGAQTALYLQRNPAHAVAVAVLLAPATYDPKQAAQSYERNYGQPLAAKLDQARDLVAKGQADALLDPVDFLYCPKAKASARTLLSYYPHEAATRDTPTLISGKSYSTPTLVVAGSEDDIIAGLAERVTPLAEQSDTIRFELIDGADHFFRDLYLEDVSDLIENAWDF